MSVSTLYSVQTSKYYANQFALMYGFQMKGTRYQWYRFHSRKYFYAMQKSTFHGLRKGIPVGIYSYGIFRFQEALKEEIGPISWMISSLAASAPFLIKYPSYNTWQICLLGGTALTGLDYLKQMQ
eukprot:NODE_1048_length_2472_cov_0.942267.p3 type:complete len:125 gc:universal NODE_1048_length_2472_cov_0.942267:455-81(-)